MSASDFQAEPAPPRRRSRWLFLPLGVFLALSGLFLIRLFAGDAARLPSALIGRPIPVFSLPPVEGVANGRGLADTDLRDGQVTLVNVFASWCVPCHQEHALLLRLARQNIRVVGLAYKDDPENIRRFLGQDGNPYARVGADRSGRSAIDWGVYGVPETFVVKGDGTIAYKFVGPLNEEDLAKTVLPEIQKAQQR